MLEQTTGVDVTYLFREALTSAIVSPPTSATDEHYEVFVPNNASLNARNSVVLSTDNITPYLDNTLLALGLHTEARTSFITYWLPAILKHKFMALRFLPQTAYERAAPLEVSPKPDNVTRVFMTFKGLRDEELEGWSIARERSTQNVMWWRDVGVEVNSALDKSSFDVLEWGGMEIL